MYLIALSTLPPVKKMKDKRRCLRLSGKAEAMCYGQTLVGWRVGGRERLQQDVRVSSFRQRLKKSSTNPRSLRAVNGITYGRVLRGWVTQTNLWQREAGFTTFSGPLLVLSETGGHGVLPSSSPLGRSLETSTGKRSVSKFDVRETITRKTSLMEQITT